MPSALNVEPRRPKRPNATSSPTPATAGGRMIGSSTIVTASERPGKRCVASQYAVGVPSTSTAACAIAVVFAVTTSASVTIGFESWWTSVPGETCTKIATTGSTMNANASRIARKYRSASRTGAGRNPARVTGPSVLHHHRRRLDDRGRGHPGLEAEVLDRVARDDGDEPHRVADDHLDLRHQALDLHVGDDRVEAVAGAQVCRARLAAQALDLARRDDAAVALVALGADASLAVPAAERVDADPEGLGGFADAVVLAGHEPTLPMQVLADVTRLEDGEPRRARGRARRVRDGDRRRLRLLRHHDVALRAGDDREPRGDAVERDGRRAGEVRAGDDQLRARLPFRERELRDRRQRRADRQEAVLEHRRLALLAQHLVDELLRGLLVGALRHDRHRV